MSFYGVGYLMGIVISLLIALRVVVVPSGVRKDQAMWSLLSILVAIWFVGRLLVFKSNSPESAFMWQKLLYFGAIYLNIVYFHFVLLFLNKKGWNGFLAIGYLTASILFALNCSTHLFVSYMQSLPGVHYYEKAGSLYFLHVLLYLIYPGIGFMLLVKEWTLEKGFKKNQIAYLMLASMIGFACGITSIPMVYGLMFQPVGAPFVGVYQFIIAYAIVKHRFMDITVIIRKTIIYSSVMSILTVSYLLIVTVTAKIFEGFAGTHSVLSSAVAAGLIAVFFQPLRKRVQHEVDAKFFRQYVDREEKLYELSREVITHTTPEAMGATLHQVLMETFHPKGGALYVRSKDGSGFMPVSQWGVIPAEAIPEDNAMVKYFADHPQPFLQNPDGEPGTHHDTRGADARGRT